MSVNKKAVQEQLAKLKQAKAQPLWQQIVELLGEEQAIEFALAHRSDGAHDKHKGGRPQKLETKLIQAGIVGLARHGEKTSPDQIADLLQRHRIAPISGTDYVAVSGADLSAGLEKMWEIIETELRERGVGSDNIDALTREAFTAALQKHFGGPEVDVVEVGPDNDPGCYPALKFTKGGVRRAVNRIKKQKSLARAYTKD